MFRLLYNLISASKKIAHVHYLENKYYQFTSKTYWLSRILTIILFPRTSFHTL